MNKQNNINILFVVFDYGDRTYKKMPWRLLTEVIPIIAKDSRFKIFILTDTKETKKIKNIFENKNINLITVSKPILRYPYRGLYHVLYKLLNKLDIDYVFVFVGWNIGMWKKISEKLNIKNLYLISFMPIYNISEIIRILPDYTMSLIKKGTIKDLINIIKLLLENVLIRINIKSVNNRNTNHIKEILVASESSKKFFQKNGFNVHLIAPNININNYYNIILKKRGDAKSSIAYFGPLILARGYDIVIDQASKNYNVVIYSRDKLSKKLLDALSKNNIMVVEKFFKTEQDIIEQARKHDIILLPFRFVVSDIPLVVLELACSGRIVVTTRYSHIVNTRAPNLVIIELRQVKNKNVFSKLIEISRRIDVRTDCKVSWKEAANVILRILDNRSG